ncbi:MAG TPA: ABC transporter ATP-binding protein [Pilimelia sp.]|nr:ABC transporter ATP-binding protein [Pilimelia sp.]
MTGDGAAGAGLAARLRLDRGAFRLDAALEVGPGEVVALLGPNGAGKSTALRALAGLSPLDAGRIRLGAAVLDSPADGVFVPAHRRAVGVVFQDYLLFPHLSTLDNVAFGPRCRGAGRAAARATARSWLERVGVADLARRRPGQLSGGQAQRVALARALATRPELLLLDEPLAALDAQTRLEVRAELRRHLAGHPGATVLVTHDPLDAMVLADRIVVLEDGRVAQQGDPAEITRRPRTPYVARLVGLNLLSGVAAGHTVRLPDGLRLAVAEPVHGPALVAFAPAAVALFRARPDGSPRNLWAATVDGVEAYGDRVRVHLHGPVPATAEVTPAAAAELGLVDGAAVWAAVKATETHAYPA